MSEEWHIWQQRRQRKEVLATAIREEKEMTHGDEPLEMIVDNRESSCADWMGNKGRGTSSLHSTLNPLWTQACEFSIQFLYHIVYINRVPIKFTFLGFAILHLALK